MSSVVSVTRAPLRPNAATPALAAAVAAGGSVLLRLEPSAWTGVMAVAAAILVWVAAIDLESRLLPDRIVLPATLGVLIASALVQPTETIEHVLSALLAGGLLLIAALIRPGDLGFGDAKLMLLVGAMLGRSVGSALLLGFGLFALVGLVLLARDGRSALKRHLPLGPFIAIGTIAVLLLGG